MKGRSRLWENRDAPNEYDGANGSTEIKLAQLVKLLPCDGTERHIPTKRRQG